VLSCAEEFPQHIALPRGCLSEVQDLFAAHGMAVDLAEERQHGTPLAAAFRGTLTPAQQRATAVLLAHDTGVLCAPTAFGKTVAAAWLIAAREVSTLVLVHRRHLLDQWRERLATFLDLPATAIGQIGGPPVCAAGHPPPDRLPAAGDRGGARHPGRIHGPSQRCAAQRADLRGPHRCP
jgi:hypothetical protein